MRIVSLFRHRLYYYIEISQGLINGVIKLSESFLLEKSNEIKLSIQNSDI